MTKKIINVNAVDFNNAVKAYNEYALALNKLAIKANVNVSIIDAHVRVVAQGTTIVPVQNKKVAAPVKEEAKKETVKTVRQPVSLRNRNSFNLHELNAHGIEAIDVNKVVCVDNVDNTKPEVFRAVLTQLQEAGVKEVHFRFYGPFGIEHRKIAAEFTRSGMLVKEGAQTSEQKVRREKAKSQKYMSDANMASLEASAPAVEKKMAPKSNKRYMSDANMASLEASAPQSVKAKESVPAKVITAEVNTKEEKTSIVETEVETPAVESIMKEEVPEPTSLNLISPEEDPTLEEDLDAQFAAFMANELAKEDKKEEEKVKAEDCFDNGEIRVPSFEDMLNSNNICQGVVTTTVGKGDDDTPDMFDDYPEPIVEELAPVAEDDNSSVMRGARVRRG